MNRPNGFSASECLVIGLVALAITFLFVRWHGARNLPPHIPVIAEAGQ